jgi:hypothetical protein
LQKLQFKQVAVEYDNLTEIKTHYKTVIEAEKFLFDGIDSVSEECIINENATYKADVAKGLTSIQKHLKALIKVVDEGLKKYPVQTLVKDEDGAPIDPGLCPMFLFLPTKL